MRRPTGRGPQHHLIEGRRSIAGGDNACLQALGERDELGWIGLRRSEIGRDGRRRGDGLLELEQLLGVILEALLVLLADVAAGQRRANHQRGTDDSGDQGRLGNHELASRSFMRWDPN